MSPLKKVILAFIFLSAQFLAFGQTIETGHAAYYHDKFEGRKTASGEVFDQSKLTAAHRTLPFGTFVKVTNLANNKSVIVKINDRGPFSKNRIIDLSRSAASELAYIQKGTAKVTIEIVEEESKETESPHQDD